MPEIEIDATIEDIEYTPLMCDDDLNRYSVRDLESGEAFQDSKFLLEDGDDTYAFSQWVSPKRTRSYPRARVYDTYNHRNRVTIIPLVKDEGKDGDRDYLQWDTLSLMSLLQVYTIVAYYDKADSNPEYENKITNQQFNHEYIANQFEKLRSYKSDALHWNLQQASELDEVAERAEEAYYEKITTETGVEMTSKSWFDKRMESVTQESERFKNLSRELAEEAQDRESVTVQPKEKTQEDSDKGRITIQNYLGGEYYFTVDEAEIIGDSLFLIEKKHTRGIFPSLDDIKNGIVLMILFTNLAEVRVGGREYKPVPVLGITGEDFPGYCSSSESIEDNIGEISTRAQNKVEAVFEEGKANGFEVYAVNSQDSGMEEKIIRDISQK